ncbi:MAG: hypothetical protein ACJ740_11915 [Gaiellales bacterium]
MNGSEHERVAELLSLLRPAPECAVRAAQEMPLLAATVDQLIERAQADDAFRRSLIADLEATLTAEGHQLHRFTLGRLRERLADL